MFVTLVWLVGAVGSLASIAIIWVLRVSYGGYVYVSGLGADGATTADGFNAALLWLGVSGAMLALALRHVHERASRRGAVLIWLLILTAGLCFIVASRVPCSAGCPVPGSDDFTAADAIHLTAAITGFVLACIAMLVVAIVEPVRTSQIVAIVAVALVAGLSSTGGLLALFAVDGNFGAWFEFAAMTIAVCWLVAYVSGRMLPRARVRAFGSNPSRSTRTSGAGLGR